MENIEQLRKEVDEIRTSLNTLKSNVSLSDSEKKSKVESIKSQAETVKDKIQKRISSLENKSDAASKKEKEEAQALLDSFSEITSLYNSITNTPKTTPSTQSQQSETVSQNKNIFEKAKDWIGTQWKDIWKQEKWDESPGTNILRTLGFAATGIGGAALAYKGLKSLWNSTFGKKKKKGKDTDNESDAKGKDNTPEKKSFWNTKFGKALTWLGIGSAAGGGVYFLGKKFNRWGKSDKHGSTTEKSDKQNENVPKGGNKISEDMFQQLLIMEGSNDFVAQVQAKDFGEKFPTGPYGQVYKYIDENGNLLEKEVPFKNGERVSKDWALKNARARYDICAKKWKEALDKKHLEYNQNELDSLVSASGGTNESRERLESYVFSNWSNKESISKFMSTFATTAAGNHEEQPGLVIRREFESNWFMGIHKPFREYQEEYYKKHPRKNKRRK